MKYGLRSSSLGNIASFITNFLINFLMTPIVAMALGKSVYGQWALLLTVVNYFRIFGIGIDAAIRVFIAQDISTNNHKAASDNASTAFVLMTGLGIMGTVLAFIFKSNIIQFLDIHFMDALEQGRLENSLQILLLLGVLTFPLSLLSSIYTALGKFNFNNSINTFANCFRAFLVYYLLKNGHGIQGVAVATVIEVVVKLILLTIFFKKTIPSVAIKAKYFNRTSFNALFSFGLSTLVLSAGDILRFNIDSIVIAKYINVESVAIFSVATIVVTNCLTIITTLFSVYGPRFSHLYARNELATLKMEFKNSQFFSAIMGYGSIFLCYVLGFSFIKIWMGEQYYESVRVLNLMILGFGISFSQYSGIVLLYSINRHHLFAKMTILEGLLNLVLSLLLVKKFGVAGVALGTVIPMIFMKMLIQPYLVCSSLNISFREYYRPHFLTWLICLVAFAIIKLINFFPQDLPVTNLPSFILWAAGLGSLFFITNVVLINLFNTNKLKFGFYDQAH